MEEAETETEDSVPQRFPVKRLYRRPLPEAPLYLERRQSVRLAVTSRVDYGDMTW